MEKLLSYAARFRSADQGTPALKCALRGGEQRLEFDNSAAAADVTVFAAALVTDETPSIAP